MARRPAVTRRGGAALERPPRRTFCSERDFLASSQPSVKLSHPFLNPPDLPEQPLVSFLVLLSCGLELLLVRRQLVRQLSALALKGLTLVMGRWHREPGVV